MSRDTRHILIVGALMIVGLVAAVGGIQFGLMVWSRRHSLPIVHYAPAENLEALDVAALDRATRTIDMAAYTLTDYPVIEALGRAARRGVAVRILVDRAQLETRPESPPLIALQDVAGVSLKVKRGRIYMHLKAYQIDGRWLRTGSANFSASGLKQQDNDWILIDNAGAATRFAADFERMFGEADTQ